ncbi:hypothetical protein ACQKEF_24300 [Pseudomonas oryzihabitans]|uniref:hypothetical protein n=1 Tax=Pseudomonas oryzihabitans TaxID=47885 RepID=UPI003D0327BE
MKCARLVALAAEAAAVAGYASNDAGSKLVPDSAFVSPYYRAWDGKASSLIFANEEPPRFSSNFSASDKLFAVFGISSLRTLQAKGIRNLYLLQATRKKVLDAIQPATSSKVSSNNDGSFVAHNLIGIDIGAAGIAMPILGDATFDPRTELGFSYFFGKRTETVNLNDAIQKCEEKITGMVNSPFQSTTRVLCIGFGQVRVGTIQCHSNQEIGEISIGAEAFATDGYASQDLKGGCSQHYCNSDSAKTCERRK